MSAHETVHLVAPQPLSWLEKRIQAAEDGAKDAFKTESLAGPNAQARFLKLAAKLRLQGKKYAIF